MSPDQTLTDNAHKTQPSGALLHLPFITRGVHIRGSSPVGIFSDALIRHGVLASGRPQRSVN